MFRVRISGLVLITAVLLPACAYLSDVRSPSGTTTTLILLRHAERPPLGKDLTDAGRARAAALPAALLGIPVDAIYSPTLSRNRDTVAPLAKQRGLSVKTIEMSYAVRLDLAARLIRDNPGKTVLWVGNSDNLHDIYERIGGPGVPPVKYGDLFIVRVPDQGPVQVTRSHYGR